MRVALIDADVVVYEAATAAEYAIEWGGDIWTLHSRFEPARDHFDRSIAALLEKTGSDRAVLALSDYTDPWRRKVMSSYKANRNGKRKPLVYSPLREYAHEAYETWQRPGLEGDDVLGVLMTHPRVFDGAERVCISIDKDMKTIPGEHYNMGRSEAFSVTVDQANLAHLTQTVTGDTTDGYPGCPGVGPVSAEKLLDPFVNHESGVFDVAGAWQAIVAAYKKKGLSEDVALMNARVARICRYEDFNFDSRSVILWNPPR